MSQCPSEVGPQIAHESMDTSIFDSVDISIQTCLVALSTELVCSNRLLIMAASDMACCKDAQCCCGACKQSLHFPMPSLRMT